MRRNDLEVTSGESSCCLQEHAHDGKTRSPRRIRGEWVPQHLTGDIRSGIGIALHDQGPILIHTIGNELVLTAWDDDNDGLPS